MHGTDVYSFWRASLAGTGTAPQHLPTLYPTAAFDNPQPGMWKLRLTKGGPFVPCQIWLTDETGEPAHKWRDGLTLTGTINGKPVDGDKLADRWLYCVPVSKADFAHYKAEGLWPGEIEAAPIGDNSKGLTLADEIEDAASNALDWLRSIKAIRNADDKDKAANWRDRLNKLAKRADAEREAEKRPHIEAGAAIEKRYKPLITRGKEAADALRAALTVFMTNEEAKAKAEAAARFRAEQERIAAERAAAEAARAKLKRDDPIAEMLTPEPELPEIPTAPEPVKIQAGGQSGKRTGLRTVTRYVVNDYDAALAAVRDHKDVRAAVEKVAAAMARAGAKVPGVETVTEKVAA